MLRSRLIVGCLAAGFIAAGLVAAGWAIPHRTAARTVTVVSHQADERLVVATSVLTDWLETHDHAALEYEAPSPLGCRASRQKWHKGLGWDCVFGITYEDESTRRYTLYLDVQNQPFAISRTARHETVAPPA